LEDKRTKIIKTAARLFTKKGFHATPTSLIAKESGVAVGTLFHHFKNKDELINSIYFEIKREMSGFFRNSLNPSHDFKTAAEFLWNDFVKWGLENHNKFGFITQFYNSPYISNVTKEQASRGFEFISPIVAKASEEKVIKNLNMTLFESIWFSSVTCIINYLMLNPDEDVESIIRISFSIFWSGVSA